jgi:hypothetical protein
MKTLDCGSCFFFSHDEGVYYGQCHRFPPVEVREDRPAEHPIVKPSDWCGEWRTSDVVKPGRNSKAGVSLC